MLTITDLFTFNAVSNKGEGFDAIFRVRRLKQDEVKTYVDRLTKNHDGYKSIVSTKTAAEEFTKILGVKVDKFKSAVFTPEDFLKVNRTNILLYGEKNKDNGTYLWYLISIPESADPNQ